MTKEENRAIAQKLFSEPCIGKTDRFHRGNCLHCCLCGEGKPNTADGLGKEPNYAGWQRLYVQAGRIVPEKFVEAFMEAINDDNDMFVAALVDDIKYFGVRLVR